jgi:hypothetical protein
MTGCSISPASNRTCELGTPKCEIHHHLEFGPPPVAPFWRDRRTGYRYRFLLTACRSSDMTPHVVYEGTLSGCRFMMPADEFHDGRFEADWEGGVAPAPPSST